MTDLFARVLLPVADPDDAAATCRALAGYDVGAVRAVHVIEKAGGAMDKASVEQREERAQEIFAVVEERLDGTGIAVESDVVYGTDVAETIFDAADDYGASAIVITPRGGSRWIRLLTGDVALDLVTKTDRPVVVLPDAERDGTGEPDGGVDDATADGPESSSRGGSDR